MAVRRGEARYGGRESEESEGREGVEYPYYNYPYVCLSVCLSVGVPKLPVTILARAFREMSLTVRIV